MERKNQSRRFCVRPVTLFCILFLFGCSNDSVDDISLKDLSELPSKHPVVVVNFWATWCPPCLTEIPHLNRFQKERPDVKVYGISVDDPALGREVFKFVKKYKIDYPVYTRGRSSENENNSDTPWYQDTDAIPVTYIFKNGKLHNSIFGAIEEQNELAEAIDGNSEEEMYVDSEDSEESEDYEYSEEGDE